MKQIILELDDSDYDAVQKALASRLTHCKPNEASDTLEGSVIASGAYIAEICRGYLEMLGKWPGWCGGDDS